MAEFKPMVKMMTTEPSIELKLKKGGKVEKKAMGGPMAMPSSMPARGGMAATAAPMKPSLAMRRRAMKGMPSGAAPAGPVGPAANMPAMKEGGESKAEHKAEMKAIKGVKSELKSHEGKSASKAHKGLKTGGVVDGQGGYAKGGIINTEGQGGAYRNTKMNTAKPDHSPAKTGQVKEGNGGGYATGGVAKANAGGYKKGGSPKKAYATGGLVDTGRPVAMPQGSKPMPKPVSINQLSGTYKKGGAVAPGNRKLQAISTKENATAMREAKAMSNEKYGSANVKRLKSGGNVDLSNGAYDKAIGPSESEMNMARTIRDFPSKVFDKVKNAAKDFFPSAPKADSVTKTKESVTVTPGKKRGGSVKC